MVDLEKLEKKLHKKAFPKENGCPVCKYGWKSYHGDYDKLCDKHYLEIEPTK